MDSKYYFTFNFVDVIYCVGIPISKIRGVYMYIDCPECFYNPQTGHSGKGKCEVRIQSGVYSCPRCGTFKGGMLDLYRYYRNCDSHTANKEMREYVGAPQYRQRKLQVQKIVESAERSVFDNVNLAKRNEIDRTYRTFLSLCSLAEKHKKDLIRRGLSEKNIAHFGFKSTPVTYEERHKIISELLHRGCTLKGVPGFYVNKTGQWDINIYNKIEGYFIPMCNLQNQCLGIQIRLDAPDPKKGKYTWLSSNGMNQGVKRTSVPHITNTHNLSDSIYVTEGGLKADIAHILSNRTFMAIAGVTQFKVLPVIFSQFKKNGVKRIIDSFDSDCKYNTNVERARQTIKYYAVKAGLEYYRMEWDEKYKGIDDYLLANPPGTRKFVVYDK